MLKKVILAGSLVLATIFANAQVGIGTTSPSNALDVETNEAGGTAIDINNTGTGDPKINLQLNGTTTFSIGVDNDDADKLKIGTTAPETNTRITIDNTGNVGVGTSAPSEKLDIESSDANKTAVDINNTGGGDPKINLQVGGTTTFSIGIDNSDADKLKIGTSALETNTRVTIDATGNVGVGTTTPGAKLDVDGDAIFNESGAAKNFRVESDANTHMLFIDGTNNEIGINTSSPASTLDIQGSLGYKVTTITAATTLNQTHNVVLCNTGPYTVTLPAAATNTGKVYYIKNIDAEGDDITIDGNASETIDGGLTFILDPYKHAVRIISDGTNWHVLEESGMFLNLSSFNSINCDGSIFTWADVTNATTGKTWMDRNLGAKQVATSSTDANSYGDLYQWGRLKDGHQCRTSTTTTTLSKNDVPGHGSFITGASNWRSTQNDNLWQGVNGINNPCPSGYRLPTETEWASEAASWGSSNAAGAFASALKLPMTGERLNSNGSLNQVNTVGSYWSSTVNGTSSRGRWFLSSSGGMFTEKRAFGSSVRCIKN
jgi:uncharacterized protein (TIGR02145 family)